MMSKFSNQMSLMRISPGDVFEMAVYDCFEGRFKLLKKSLGKIYVEVVDVCMCYPQQVQSQPGDKYWIEEREIAEIFKSENERKRVRRLEYFIDAPRRFWRQKSQMW